MDDNKISIINFPKLNLEDHQEEIAEEDENTPKQSSIDTIDELVVYGNEIIENIQYLHKKIDEGKVSELELELVKTFIGFPDHLELHEMDMSISTRKEARENLSDLKLFTTLEEVLLTKNLNLLNDLRHEDINEYLDEIHTVAEDIQDSITNDIGLCVSSVGAICSLDLAKTKKDNVLSFKDRIKGREVEDEYEDRKYVQDQLISSLEKLLSKAKSGQLTRLCYASTSDDHGVLEWGLLGSWRSPYEILGTVDRLHDKVKNTVNIMEKEEMEDYEDD